MHFYHKGTKKEAIKSVDEDKGEDFLPQRHRGRVERVPVKQMITGKMSRCDPDL